MKEYIGCEYCIPDKNHECKPLIVSHFFADGPDDTETHAVDKTRIERDLRYSYSLDKKDYILAVHREAVMSKNPRCSYTKEHITPVFRTNEIAINIIACPKCGRQLDQDIPDDHPLLNR